MDKLYVVMPAYNEEETIRSVVEEWYPVLDGKPDASRILIADSGSSDQTHVILENLQKTYPKLEILSNTKRQHGPKVIALYEYAVKNHADYIFQTDSDGQTDAAEFEGFWELRKQYDAVLGYRTARGDGRSRAWVERVVCFLLWVFFGVKVPDANAPFRLMKSAAVKKYLGRLPKDYDLPNIMMTAYFARFQENIIFKQITFKPRRGGVNSIDLQRIVKIGWKALGDFRQFRKGMGRA